MSALPSNTGSNLPECMRRDPSHTLGRNLNFIIQLINLLKRKALGLINHEVHESDTQEAASEPDEEDLRLQVCVSGTPVDEVRSGVRNCPVEKPVGGRGHGETLGADLERKDLTGHDPGDGTPGGGEEEDVDADECDAGLLGFEVLAEDRSVGRVLASGGRTEDGDEKLRDCHADS